MSGALLRADGRLHPDGWHLLREALADDATRLPLLLPLADYLAEPPSPLLGVWLGPADDALALRARIAASALPLVAIDFPRFADGRGYSQAALLRNRLRYRGELRAVGEVLVDQLFMLRRVGFDSFALRADQPVTDALAALVRYSAVYQRAADDAATAASRRVPGSIPHHATAESGE
jgi:uncharacterized protein (DUF934 family)